MRRITGTSKEMRSLCTPTRSALFTTLVKRTCTMTCPSVHQPMLKRNQKHLVRY
nr:hypothetical protein Iba_scaffold11405CG0030 [Ipomoea batatas]